MNFVEKRFQVNWERTARSVDFNQDLSKSAQGTFASAASPSLEFQESLASECCARACHFPGVHTSSASIVPTPWLAE